MGCFKEVVVLVVMIATVDFTDTHIFLLCASHAMCCCCCCFLFFYDGDGREEAPDDPMLFGDGR